MRRHKNCHQDRGRGRHLTYILGWDKQGLIQNEQNRSFKYKNTCVGLISRYELIHWLCLFTEFYDVVFTQENAHCCPYPPSDEGLPSTPEYTYCTSGHKNWAKIVLAMTFYVLKSSMSSEGAKLTVLTVCNFAIWFWKFVQLNTKVMSL